MSKQEIFTKAIEKAEKGGFDLLTWCDKHHLSWGNIPAKGYENDPTVINSIKEYKIRFLVDDEAERKLLLTDHKFCKALWTSDLPENCHQCQNPMLKGIHTCDKGYNWKWHLQHMVVSEDWLTYVGGTL